MYVSVSSGSRYGSAEIDESKSWQMLGWVKAKLTGGSLDVSFVIFGLGEESVEPNNRISLSPVGTECVVLCCAVP